LLVIPLPHKQCLFRVSFAVISVCCFVSLAQLCAQELHCEKLQSHNAQSECYDSQLEKSEGEMQRAYERALAAFTYTPQDQKELYRGLTKYEEGWDKRLRRQLKESQRLWLAYCESTCRVLEKEYEGGNITAQVVPVCKRELTEQRTKWLEVSFATRLGKTMHQRSRSPQKISHPSDSCR
jgi:uncharacterized protein YecT (DUF1311 family)